MTALCLLKLFNKYVVDSERGVWL